MNREEMTKRTGITGMIGMTKRNDWDDQHDKDDKDDQDAWNDCDSLVVQSRYRPVTNICNTRFFFSLGMRKTL